MGLVEVALVIETAFLEQMMDKIYIVRGYCGGEFDYSEWIAAVYLDKDLAQEHAKKAKEYLKAYKDKGYSLCETESPYDDEGGCIFTDSEYDVVEYGIKSTVPSEGEDYKIGSQDE